MCPKLTRHHIDISSFGCMKVSFAAQVMISTVANALEQYYGDRTSSTVSFIRHINKFFDCLNTRNFNEGIIKRNKNAQPYSSVEDPRLDYLSNDFLQYFDDWKTRIENRPDNLTKSEMNSMQLSHQTLGLQITVKSVVECKILPKCGNEICFDSASTRILPNNTLEFIELVVGAIQTPHWIDLMIPWSG